jgi:CheY-like chemotaxis protein
MTDADPTPLEGLRVLVVEDEALLSLALQDMLTDLGCIVAGQAARLEAALALAGTVECDAAILDLNLAGKRVDPVVEVLTRRGIPIVFATGYGQAGVDPRHQGGPVLEKPFGIEELRRALLPLSAARASG